MPNPYNIVYKLRKYDITSDGTGYKIYIRDGSLVDEVVVPQNKNGFDTVDRVQLIKEKINNLTWVNYYYHLEQQY